MMATTDLDVFFQQWLGRISYGQAIEMHDVRVDAIPDLARVFSQMVCLESGCPGRGSPNGRSGRR